MPFLSTYTFLLGGILEFHFKIEVPFAVFISSVSSLQFEDSYELYLYFKFTKTFLNKSGDYYTLKKFI